MFISIPFDSSFTRERLLNELRETEEASRRQAEVLVKVSLVKIFEAAAALGMIVVNISAYNGK